MRSLLLIPILMLSTSCLKKVEEVETANTNIFDPEYVGEKWFNFDDVFTFTDSNNNQWLRFEYSIPEENTPVIQPTNIACSISINGATPVISYAAVQYEGHYEGVLDIIPTGETNFCLNIGVYIEDEDLTINNFEECRSL